MSKVTTTSEPLVSAPSTENQTPKFAEATSNIYGTDEIKPTTRTETMEKITDVRNIIWLTKETYFISILFIFIYRNIIQMIILIDMNFFRVCYLLFTSCMIFFV